MTTRTNETTTDLHHLPIGTRVVSDLDGEPGRVVEVAGQNRSRTKTTSYVVETAYGREVWCVGDIFVPDMQD